ncbi:MAG: hypothetical protein ACW98F_11860 [Candidatus Hodarchaeales archaeon]|jgi:hypothetical protein
MLIYYLSQWDDYIRGWQLLIESGDQVLWIFLVFIAWLVRAISLIMLLIRLGDRVIRNKKEIELNILATGITFLFVTVPFFLAGLPLIYPFIP